MNVVIFIISSSSFPISTGYLNKRNSPISPPQMQVHEKIFYIHNYSFTSWTLYRYHHAFITLNCTFFLCSSLYSCMVSWFLCIVFSSISGTFVYYMGLYYLILLMRLKRKLQWAPNYLLRLLVRDWMFFSPIEVFEFIIFTTQLYA